MRATGSGFEPGLDRWMDVIDRRGLASHGVILRRELLAEGLSERAIDHAIATGRLVRLFDGVYRHAAIELCRQGELFAVQAWAGPKSFFSHRTGAEILNLEGAPIGVTEICLPMGLEAPGVKIHRISEDDRPPIHTHDGLRVAHVERTLLDLAAKVRYGTLGICMDDALRRRMTTIERLQDALRTYGRRGKNGTRAFRTMVDLRDDRDGQLASRFEAKMLRILRRIQDHTHEPQYRVDSGDETFYIDFAFPHVKLGIECQSIKWHLGEGRFKRDLRRDRLLKLLGWTILYFTWDDVHLAPKEVETQIRQALANLLRHPHQM